MTEYQIYLKNLSEKIISFILILLMMLIPFSHYLILAVDNYYNLIQNSIYTCSSILFLISLLGILQGAFKIRKKTIPILIGVLLFIALLSTFTSLDVSRSIWGDSGRYEGLFMLMSYYIIFISSMLITSDKRKLFLLNAFILIGIIHCFYGICQRFDLFEGIVIDRYGNSVSGVAGNPNFMGTYTVLLSGLASSFFYFSKNIKNRIMYLIALGIFLITLILTNAMSALFGVSIMVIVFFAIIISTWKKYDNRSEKLSSFKLLIAGSVVIFCGIAGVIILTGNQYIGQVIEMMNDLKDLVTGGEITVESGARRFLVWKESLTLIPNYFLFGSGLDTFGLAYHGVFPVREEYFNKAHNELIQIVITQGVPALVCYLTLYGHVIKSGIIKFKNLYITKADLSYDFIYYGLLIATIGYIFQAMFNISVIDVAPFFWMIFGLLASFFANDKNKDDLF